jgi:predicted nucleic acid-binding protein
VSASDPEILVLDASVAVKFFFDEPYSRAAHGVLELLRASARRAVAPELIYAEFGNAVWKRVMRGAMGSDDGLAVITAFRDLPLGVVPNRELLVAAYALAVEHGRSLYDALYLALSVESGAPFVTADEALYRAVERHIPGTRWLGEWV